MTTKIADTAHLFRCQACLEVHALAGGRWDARPSCVCGGHLKYLGQVNDGRLIERFEAPACDFRCTDAISKACSCQCMGRNHGTHRTREIEIVNGLPKIADFTDAEACRLRAHEYKAARVAVWARYEERYGAEHLATYRAGGHVTSKAAWWAIQETTNAINAAGKLTSHAGRLRRLDAIRP